MTDRPGVSTEGMSDDNDNSSAQLKFARLLPPLVRELAHSMNPSVAEFKIVD